MKLTLATVAATKLLLTGYNPTSYREIKYKYSEKLFNKALVNYYRRIQCLYDSVLSENRKFKVWYNYSDGIKIIFISKTFGAIYTGSVVYGFSIVNESDEENKKVLNEMEFNKYFNDCKSYIKRHPYSMFNLDFSRKIGIKITAFYTKTRPMYKDLSEKEIWKHNLEVIQKLADKNNKYYSESFIKGYSEAISNYIESI